MIAIKEKFLLRNNLDKIKNKNILVRVDFNVDFKNGKIFDQYRILAIKQTLNFLKSARQVILISHLGDDKKLSFKKLIPEISKILKIKIGFLENLNSKPKEKFSLLENLRKWKEEKECNPGFAKKLSLLGEIFVFEAFSVSHRKHSSVYLLPKILPTFYGFNFEKEINLLNKVLKIKNLTLILGGAKISTKLPLIEKFLNRADLIILAGGLANTFLKAKGFEIGNSLVENELLRKIKKLYSAKILTPFDFYVLNKNKIYHRYLGEIQKEDKIFDAGEESLKIFFKEIKKAKNIVINGTLGFVEDKRFEKGTLLLIKFLAQFKNKFILFGGGDTLAFLTKKKFLKRFKISTGGGAMLHYLANETLWPIK
ncbi:MAG: phosphoglycerate kinase [Candidatus Parcubacteria bacterium]|nr:MAG: phosphoglycerate kinase [Candidatus Parcubacteria bacterium]